MDRLARYARVVLEIVMIPGFSNLSVRGYRRLKSVDVPLRRLNVLIGANGVGKTSILDVFRLLSVSADRRLVASVLEAGGLRSILTADGSTSALEFSIAYQPEAKGEITYELSLAEQGALPVVTIGNERLSQTPVDGSARPAMWIETRAGWPDYHGDNEVRTVLTDPGYDRSTYERSETALSQSPPFSKAIVFRHMLSRVSAIYHSLDVSPRAPVKGPQRLYPTKTPGVNGEDLLSSLWTIRETDYGRYEDIENSLRAAFPSFEKLEFPPVAAGMFSLGWRDSTFTRPLYANELSEGTLRFLWLATLLQSPELPAVTLIDEPEISLHPEMLRIIAELMRDAAERTQLVVATHADRLVRFLRPEELLVCDLDESGGMTTQWADELDLKAWLEDYTLDQLWSKGILGGRS
jgi:predicted ATPase